MTLAYQRPVRALSPVLSLFFLLGIACADGGADRAPPGTGDDDDDDAGVVDGGGTGDGEDGGIRDDAGPDDGGRPDDAAMPDDAGTDDDAGIPDDAGPSSDGGVDSGVDAGPADGGPGDGGPGDGGASDAGDPCGDVGESCRSDADCAGSLSCYEGGGGSFCGAAESCGGFAGTTCADGRPCITPSSGTLGSCGDAAERDCICTKASAVVGAGCP